VAQVALNDAQIDAGFEEMSGVGMAQGVNRNGFFPHSGIPFGAAKSALDTAFSHGIERLFGARSASAKGWEEKMRMAMRAPIPAQQMQSGQRQRDIAVLGALAAVDMDHHALTVDIGDFEMQGFVKP
jgi:hypothetical protein